ncbi:zinc finger and SCAN domain-containing protein 2 [Nephila pilipes]|uniref:Zinc finger and SCAN domain-containing protein 2 n=1 Tax=Nephila pilipes TaxID=299642 RepID=A0A8X6MTN7_NEPPI|nr:zinc finger and SCAN domain-containing protein 2 [Nephila pilipes]
MSLIRVITRIYPNNVISEGLSKKLLHPTEFGNPSKIHICCITDPRNGLEYKMETTFLTQKLDLSEDTDKEISLQCEKFPGLICAPENSVLLSPVESTEIGKDYAVLSVPKSIHRDEVSHFLNIGNEKVGTEFQQNLMYRSNDTESNVEANEDNATYLALNCVHQNEISNSLDAVNKKTDTESEKGCIVEISNNHAAFSRVESNPLDEMLYIQSVKNKGTDSESEKGCGIKIRLNLKKIKEDCADHHALRKARGKLLQPLLCYFIENECLICGFITSKVSKQSNIKHLLCHIDGNSNCYLCNSCEITFSTAKALYQHAVKHVKVKSYCCDTCNKKYQRKHSLTVHQLICHYTHLLFPTNMRRNHCVLKQKMIPLFICTICNIRLTSKDDSITDHKMIHAGKEKYQCLFCGKLFKNDFFINSHIHIHTKRSSYTCKVLGKSKSASYGQLQKNHKIHVRTLNVCPLCGKRFYFLNNLLIHVRHLHRIA